MSWLANMFRYRGREGMLAWAFHRISGLGIFAFVVLHVLDIYLVGGNPAKVIKFRFGEKQIEELLKIAWWNWMTRKLQKCFLCSCRTT